MIKISRDVSKVPWWLDVTKTMVPDFVANDPQVSSLILVEYLVFCDINFFFLNNRNNIQKMPVWEIVGHEFTKHEVHTADGISIRFPRVLRVRDDKTWETATNVSELKVSLKKI